MSQSFVQVSGRAGSPAPTRRRRLSNWGQALQLWLDRRYGLQQLNLLDDRLLDDVRISREDALWKAGKPFWGP